MGRVRGRVFLVRTVAAVALATTVGIALLARAAAPRSVTLVAVGDILLARRVAKAIHTRGPDHPFHAVTSVLRSADIAFGNLECPITRDAVPVPKLFSFRALPEHAGGLRRAGFDVLSLANNHTLDCGEMGLQDTLEFLRQEGMATCGAGSVTGAYAPTIVKRNGVRIAFVAFCDVVQDGVFPDTGQFVVARASHEAVSQAVRTALAQADIVAVSLHWGREYAPRPTERQRALARTAAAAGAHLVLGHHPHVVQEVAWLPRTSVGRTLVAYSLGNFVFDTHRLGADRSVILRVHLSRHGVLSAETMPVRIEACVPRLSGKPQTKTPTGPSREASVR